MRIEIYNDEPREKVLRVKLVANLNAVSLVAVGPDGEEIRHGYLINITTDGRIHRHGNIAPSLGLDLDECGRIKLTEE